MESAYFHGRIKPRERHGSCRDRLVVGNIRTVKCAGTPLALDGRLARAMIPPLSMPPTDLSCPIPRNRVLKSLSDRCNPHNRSLRRLGDGKSVVPNPWAVANALRTADHKICTSTDGAKASCIAGAVGL